MTSKKANVVMLAGLLLVACSSDGQTGGSTGGAGGGFGTAGGGSAGSATGGTGGTGTGGTSGGGTGGSSGSGTGGSSGSAGAPPGDGGACDLNQPNSCGVCQAEKCCSDLQACSRNAGCACMAECVGANNLGGLAGCRTQCSVTSDPADFAALLACMQSGCPDADECG